MSKTEPTPRQVAALKDIKEKFDTWRRTRSGKRRIPDYLWQATIALFFAGGFSLNKIARELRLGHSDLKHRVDQYSSNALKTASEESSTFVEIEPPSSFPECIIEMEDQSGTKMRMCFRGKADPGLVEIGKSFLRARV